MIKLKVLLIVGVVLLLFVLFLCSRIWVLFEYKKEGPFLWAGFGFFYVQIYPAGKLMKRLTGSRGEKRKKKKEKPPDKKKASESGKKGASFELFQELLHLGLDVAGRFRRRLRIDMLYLHLVWGMEDPADAALSYGYAQMALHGMLPILEGAFQVKKRSVITSFDYELEKPTVYAKISFSLTLAQAISLGYYAARKGMRIKKKQKDRKNNSMKKKAG